MTGIAKKKNYGKPQWQQGVSNRCAIIEVNWLDFGISLGCLRGNCKWSGLKTTGNARRRTKIQKTMKLGWLWRTQVLHFVSVWCEQNKKYKRFEKFECDGVQRAWCVRNLLSSTCANLIVVHLDRYCRRRSRKRLSLIYLVHNNTNCDTRSAFSYLSGLRFMKSSMNVNLPQLMPFIFFYLKIRTIQLSTLYSIYDCCDQDYVYWLDVFSFFFSFSLNETEINV